MGMATQVQIQDKAVCISHSANTLEEGMYPVILFNYGWIIKKAGLFKREWQPVEEKKKFLI